MIRRNNMNEDLKEELIRLTYENNELKSQMNKLTDKIRENLIIELMT